MSEARELLAQLRDVHEPPAPDLAVPWLIVICLLVLVCAGLWLSYRVYRRRRRWLDEATLALARASRLDPEPAQLACARLLVRLLRHRHGAGADHADGSTRLALLDESFRCTWFTQDRGRIFGDALYQASAQDAFDPPRDCATLTRLLRRRAGRVRPPLARQPLSMLHPARRARP